MATIFPALNFHWNHFHLRWKVVQGKDMVVSSWNTKMIMDNALIHNPHTEYFLIHSPEEHPLAIQRSNPHSVAYFAVQRHGNDLVLHHLVAGVAMGLFLHNDDAVLLAAKDALPLLNMYVDDCIYHAYLYPILMITIDFCLRQPPMHCTTPAWSFNGCLRSGL